LATLSLAITLETSAITQYHQFAYDSMCAFNGQHYLLDGGGVYELAERFDDDNGRDIKAFARFVAHDFGLQNKKRVLSGFLSFRAKGAVNVSWGADGRSSTAQKLTAKIDDGNWQELTFGGDRRVEGTYLSFEIGNARGAYFIADELHVDLRVMKKSKSRIIRS